MEYETNIFDINLSLYFMKHLELEGWLIYLYYCSRDFRANAWFFFLHTFPAACSGNKNNFRYISTTPKVVIIIFQKTLVAYKYLNFILSILVLWLSVVSLNWCSTILIWFVFYFKNKIANNSIYKIILLIEFSLRVQNPNSYWWVFIKEAAIN